MENVAESGAIARRSKSGFHPAMKNEYIMEHLFSYLSLADIKNCRGVNRTWRKFGAKILQKRTSVAFNFLEPPGTTDEEKFKLEKMKQMKGFISHCRKLRPENSPFSSFDIKGYMKMSYLTDFMKVVRRDMKELEVSVWMKTDRLPMVLDISPFIIPEQLTKLHIDMMGLCHDKLGLSFDKIPLVKDIHLDGCVLIVGNMDDRISANKVYLGEDNAYIIDGAEGQFLVNQIFDLKWTKYINLKGSKITLDLAECANDKIERTISLKSTDVQRWDVCNWKIDKLMLDDVSFVCENLVEIKEMEINGSLVDFSKIQYPLSLKKFSCLNCSTVITGDFIPFPNLVHLSLESASSIFHLPLFTDNKNITELRLGEVNRNLGQAGLIFSMNLYILPDNVTDLTLRSVKMKGEYLYHLKTLRLIEYRPFGAFMTVMAKFRCPTVIIHYSDFYDKAQCDNVINMLKADVPYMRKRLIIGPFFWDSKTRKSGLLKYVNKEADYYIFNGTKGRALTDEEYNKYYAGFDRDSHMY